jgi:predicted amidohydrolase
MLNKRIDVAVIQYDCPPEKEAAVNQLEALAEEAAEGADIVLIAETPFTPYTTVDDYRPVAEPIPGPYSDRLGRLAQRCGVYVCSGTVEREGDSVYNTAILISPGGDIILKHRKCTLGPGDAEGGYAPGKAVDVVDTPFGRVGILICLDTIDRGNQSAMAAHKPDVVFVPSYGLAKTNYATSQHIDCMVDECLDEWRARMVMLAKFCGAYVLRADHCGVEGPLVRVGHSLAVMPGGHVLAEATMRPSILRVTLDPARAEQLRW